MVAASGSGAGSGTQKSGFTEAPISSSSQAGLLAGPGQKGHGTTGCPAEYSSAISKQLTLPAFSEVWGSGPSRTQGAIVGFCPKPGSYFLKGNAPQTAFTGRFIKKDKLVVG